MANFKETQMEDMKKDQTVEINVDAFPKQKIEGIVYSISSATGAKFSLLPPDNATGNFVKVVQRVPVKILLKADSDIVSKIRPGMSVKVSVHTNWLEMYKVLSIKYKVLGTKYQVQGTWYASLIRNTV